MNKVRHVVMLSFAITWPLSSCGIVPSQAEFERVGQGRELEVPPGLDAPTKRGVPIPKVTGEAGTVDEKPDPLEPAPNSPAPNTG